MRALGVAVFAVVFLIGCDSHNRSTQARVRAAPEGTFDSAIDSPDIYPLADGCAYIQGSSDPALWYVCSSKAMKVTGANIAGGSSIYPLADGGALAVSISDDFKTTALIAIKGSSATLVAQGYIEPKQASLSNERMKAGFFFATSAAKAQRDADQKAEDEAMDAYSERN